MFRKPDVFTSSGEEKETAALLGPLERANVHLGPTEYGFPSLYLKMETDPFSEKCFFFSRIRFSISTPTSKNINSCRST
jgi:hypothetical protein